MTPPPCASNDNLDLTNESEYSNDSGLGWGLSNTRGNIGGKGSGCDDTSDTETATPGLPTFLSCNSANAKELSRDDGIERVDLQYDYEILMNEDAELPSAVNAFELDLLRALADEFDLSSCESDIRRSLRIGRQLETTSPVVGVGSYPSDSLDSLHTECEEVGNSIESSSCTPINGFMTAWVSKADRRRLSQTEIYDVIEEFSNTYTNDEVLAVSYIGTRRGAPVIDKAIKDDGYRNDLASASPTAMAPGAIAGIAIASVLALFAVLALIAKKRKDRKNAAEANQMSIVDDALFMSDDQDDYDLKNINDDTSRSSVNTEDHTYDESISPSATGEASADDGLEVVL